MILIIPDLYDQIYVREMTGLILGGMGFKRMCMQQVRRRTTTTLADFVAGEHLRDVRCGPLDGVRDRHGRQEDLNLLCRRGTRAPRDSVRRLLT